MSVHDQATRTLRDHEGQQYLEVLRHLHQSLAPRTYLEIGTEYGPSLALAECASIAIDPHFQASGDVVGRKPLCSFFQMGSDRFFQAHDPKQVLGGPLDLVFLDGMHWFEYLLRDFANVEKHCRKNSVIVMDDCIPTDAHLARRAQGDQRWRAASHHPPDWWAGDVWKVVAILREHRPDLRFLALDAPPTGLVLVTNLNPDDRTLSDRYADLVEEVRPWEFEVEGIERIASWDVQSTDVVMAPESLGQHFWL